MKTLSTVLKDTKIIAEPLDNNSDISNMQVHGSITKAGKMSTQSISKEQAQESHQREQECFKSLELQNDSEGQNKLSKLLVICFDTMDTFGKKEEQLKSINQVFQLVLGRFEYSKIEKAFRIYMENHSVMPKPADIVEIIEPKPKKREWCKVTFLEIKRKKRENVFTTNEENQYCEDFIKASVTGDYDNRAELQDAITQAGVEDKRYWIES